MTISIAPFTVNPVFGGARLGLERRREQPDDVGSFTQITYWGICLDDKQISYTSSRELAEKTKLWMERWLKHTI